MSEATQMGALITQPQRVTWVKVLLHDEDVSVLQ